MGLVHTRDNDPGCFVANTESIVSSRRGRVLFMCPYRNITGDRCHHTSQNTSRPSGRTRSFNCTTYL